MTITLLRFCAAIQRPCKVALRNNSLQFFQTAPSFERLLGKLEPVTAASSAEQRLLQKVQSLCDDADRSLSLANASKDSKARRQILHDRLRITGRALGDSLMAAAKMKSFDVARKIFASYQQRFSVKAFHYNALLSACSSQSAFDILKEMQMKNIAPDRKTFLFIFQNCNSQGQFHAAFSSLCKAKTLGVQLDTITYTAIISAAERCQDIDVADSIFNDINRWSVQPDTIMYSMMINMHAKRGNYQHCLELYDAMRSMQLEPDQFLSALIKNIRRKTKSKQ